MQALIANVADMGLDYSKEELEAIAVRLQCCAADAAHTAMGADMYLDEDKKTCEWNKYKYLKRVSGILREYIPGGIYSFRGPIEIENEIEVPLSDAYEFRSAVCVDDVLSPIFGYSFIMFTNVTTGRGYMYVIYDGQLHDIVDSNAYPIPYFRNTNSITHDHHNDFLVMGTNTEIQKADADQEASQPPSAPSTSGFFSSVGSDYKYSVYNPRNKYVYFSNTLANQIVKYKADTNSVTTINVPGAIGKLAVNTNSGQVIVIAGSTLQLVHPVTNVLTPLNLAVLLGAVTVDNVIYNTLTNRIVVQYNDGVSNNIAILSSTGVVISPSIYSTFDIIGDILHYPTLDLYLVATSLQIEVVDANTLDVITVSELLHDKKNDKIIAISGKRLDLLLGTNDPAITSWNDEVVDEHMLRVYSMYYAKSPSDLNLSGKSLYDHAEKTVSITYRKLLPVYSNMETYTIHGGFSDFETLVDISSDFLTTYETDFVTANPFPSFVDITENIENSNYTGEAKNGDIFNVTMQTIYSPGQGDLFASFDGFSTTFDVNAIHNFLYGTGAGTVVGLTSITLARSSGSVTYQFDPLNADITNITPVTAYGISPIEPEAINIGLIQGLTDGLNPTTGFGINRVEYSIGPGVDPLLNYTASLRLKMVDDVLDINPFGSSITYTVFDGVSYNPVNIPLFSVAGSYSTGFELTHTSSQFKGSRFIIDNPVSQLVSPPFPAGELINGFFYTLNDNQPAQWECVISNGNSGDVLKAININNVDYAIPSGYTFSTDDDLGVYLTSLGLGDYETSWNASLRQFTIRKTSNNPNVPPRFVTWKREIEKDSNAYNGYYEWEKRNDVHPIPSDTTDPDFREASFGKLFTIDNPDTAYHGHEVWFYITPCPVDRISSPVSPYELRVAVYYNGEKKKDPSGNYEDYNLYTFTADLGENLASSTRTFAGANVEYDKNNNQFVIIIADDIATTSVATTDSINGNMILATLQIPFYVSPFIVPTALPYPTIPGGFIQASISSIPTQATSATTRIRSPFCLLDTNADRSGKYEYSFYNPSTGDVCFTFFSADSNPVTANANNIYHNILRYNHNTFTFDVPYSKQSPYGGGVNFDMVNTLERKMYVTTVDTVSNRYIYQDFYDPNDTDNAGYGVVPGGRQWAFLDFSFTRVNKLEMTPFLSVLSPVSTPTYYFDYGIFPLINVNNELLFMYYNFINSTSSICEITNPGTLSPSIVKKTNLPAAASPTGIFVGPGIKNIPGSSSVFFNTLSNGVLKSVDPVSWQMNGQCQLYFVTPFYSAVYPQYFFFNSVLNKLVMSFLISEHTLPPINEPNAFLNYYAVGYHEAQWESDQDAPFNPLDVTEKKITILSSPSDDQPLCLNDSEVQAMIETAQQHCCDCCPDPLDAEEIFRDPIQPGGGALDEDRFTIYYGNNGIDGAGKLNPTEITSLTSVIRYQLAGTYNYYFVPDSYLYFAYPSAYYTSTIDFEDVSTGVQLPFKAPYSIMISGIPYTVHQTKFKYNSPVSVKVIT